VRDSPVDQGLAELIQNIGIMPGEEVVLYDSVKFSVLVNRHGIPMCG